MIRFEYASDQSLMVYLGERIGLETHHRVLKLLRALESAPISGVRNLHPAYHSILIVFDPAAQDHETLERALAQYIDRLDSVTLPEPRTVEIPVIYDGPDLTGLAGLHNLTPQQVAELHSSASYIVYFIGFVPGFAYLGGLPPEARDSTA